MTVTDQRNSKKLEKIDKMCQEVKKQKKKVKWWRQVINLRSSKMLLDIISQYENCGPIHFNQLLRDFSRKEKTSVGLGGWAWASIHNQNP